MNQLGAAAVAETTGSASCVVCIVAGTAAPPPAVVVCWFVDIAAATLCGFEPHVPGYMPQILIQLQKPFCNYRKA